MSMLKRMTIRMMLQLESIRNMIYNSKIWKLIKSGDLLHSRTPLSFSTVRCKSMLTQPNTLMIFQLTMKMLSRTLNHMKMLH